MTEGFADFFQRVTGTPAHPWQRQVGDDARCADRLIRIPTGFGKTAGVVLPWMFHRLARRDETWPRRLVLTLPMRVLVEQTERAVAGWIENAGLDASVHVLMGGSDAGAWHLYPERPAVLIGTQDMILSRALNRGFGAARGRWPIDFGLLHQDALWVLDEVQLMDVGLATSVQLAQFRRDDMRHAQRPTYAWWMSATLQPRWLHSADAAVHAEELAKTMVSIPANARSGGLWDVAKPVVRRADVTTAKEIAQLTIESHVPGTLTLVIVNRVPRALEVFDAIEARLVERKGKNVTRRADAPEVEIVHSRFRGAEREQWARFLRRDADIAAAGRIVIATQVVEAGVDLSARTLVTELAPWPSLVQRFGRCARYAGEEGRVFITGAAPRDDKDAAPYDAESMKAAAALLDDAVTDASPRALEALEEALDEDRIAGLYPYAPLHVLRRPDLDELFDTSPDLSGADLDVSRFIRSGEERDVSLFWRAIEPKAPGRWPAELPVRDVPPPTRRELCRAPVFEVRAWLKKRRAYVRDYRANAWIRLSQDDLTRVHAGTTVLVEASEGGYDAARGWDPKSTKAVVPVASEPVLDLDERTASGEDEDALSQLEWQSIADHGRDAGAEAHALAKTLGLDDRLADLLALAGRWHDVGKAHPVFQSAIREEVREAEGALAQRRDLAKAPSRAWRVPPYPDRPGFRHELASMLAMLQLVRRADPLHDGLLGPHTALLAAIGRDPEPAPDPVDREHPLARELCALSASELDLVAYLVCSHHGKVRCTITSTAKDQEKGEGTIHGVREGDVIPPTAVASTAGPVELPETSLSLAPAALGVGPEFGASWSERVAGLLREHGPFALAFFEAILRAADVRVSMALVTRGGE